MIRAILLEKQVKYDGVSHIVLMNKDVYNNAQLIDKRKNMAKTQRNTLKSINKLSTNKKRFISVMLLFAVVGAVIIVRSFASTVILSFNPGDNLSDTPSVAGFSFNRANKVAETVNDGKTTRTVNYAEVSRANADNFNSYLTYAAVLDAGYYYQGCFTAKPTTQKSKARIDVYYTTDAGTTRYLSNEYLTESPEATSSAIPFKVGTFGEACATFALSAEDYGKNIQIKLEASNDREAVPANTWRVSEFALRKTSYREMTPNKLIKAGTAAIGRSAGGTKDGAGFESFYDTYGRATNLNVNIRFPGKGVLKSDVVGGSTQQVIEMTGGSTSMSTFFPNPDPTKGAPDPTKTSDRNYVGCFKVKSTVPQISMSFVMRVEGGSSPGETLVTKNVTGDQYQDICASHRGIKAGETLVYQLSTVNTATWRIQDAWIVQDIRR